jgi:hypothetical protein
MRRNALKAKSFRRQFFTDSKRKADVADKMTAASSRAAQLASGNTMRADNVTQMGV